MENRTENSLLFISEAIKKDQTEKLIDEKKYHEIWFGSFNNFDNKYKVLNFHLLKFIL